MIDLEIEKMQVKRIRIDEQQKVRTDYKNYQNLLLLAVSPNTFLAELSY